VLRIHEILDFVTDPDPAIFVSDLQDVQNFFSSNFFVFWLIVLFEGTFTSLFKDEKSSKRSHKKGDIDVFLTIFA
jgi:hypothetical protein